jgi:hypothetical protein
MRIAPLLLAFTLTVSAFAADIAGKWNLTAKDPDGNDIKGQMVLKVTLKLTLDGDTLTGNWSTEDGTTGRLECTRAKLAAAAKADSPVAGVWKIDTAGPDGNPIQAQLILKQEQGVWSGQLVVTEHGLTLPLEDIKVQGAALSLKRPTDNGSFALEGQVSADKLVATAVGPDGSQHKLSGTRQ